MHLKFLARGTGSATVAAAYLLALEDAWGKVRAAVEVLRGDPMLVAAVADGLPFKHRYTSGVAAWSPEDAPTRAELERFVDEFEKTAWAGLARDRYVWSVVLHRDDDGGVHLHFISARCDLATGRSLNIAPPGWESTFDPLRDAMNYEHGWSRPDDPSRARPFRPTPHLAYTARAAHRAGKDPEPDPRREIGMYLLELVAAGRVKDRAGVVAALETRGYDVPRQGERYVTARDPATGERWRLKGALYERDFDRARFLREMPEPFADRERADGDDDPAAAAWKAVDKARHRRAGYNRAYYGPGRRPGREVQAFGAGEVERAGGPAAGPSAGQDASLAAHLERELGDGAVTAGTAAAELVRARRAAAGGGRDERSLAASAALAEAARAASPELSRALREHEDVAARERAVCATAMGGQWLVEARQEVLAGEEDRPLSVGVRTRAVKTAEGRLETYLSRRVSAVAATSSGPALLREALGKRSYGDAPLSFPARERGLDRVEQRIDEELRTREEALRAIPPGKRYLSAAEQARVAGTAGPPTLADRESMVRAATQQVGEELDRLEQEFLAIAVGEDLLAEAAGASAGDGRTRSLGERWETCERVKNGVEEELNRREAAIRADSAGEELLRDARLEVLGSDEPEAATLGDRARIVKAAAEAKRQAETWNEEKAARVEKLCARPGGLDLYHAHLADRDPKWSLTENTPPSREHDEAALAAAESDDTRLKRLDAVLSDESDATYYQEGLDQAVGQFKTLDLDSALTAAERARAEREASARRAAADLETATEAAQAAAGRSNVELHDAHVRVIYETGETHESGLSAVERTTAALAAAADQQLPTATIIETWNANKSAPGGIAAALDAATEVACEERKAAEERAAALAAATVAARSAAGRSNVELRDAHVRVIYETGETHESGLSAVERTTAALAAAADQQLPTATIIETWNANKSAPGGIAAALDAATEVACEERKAAEERAAAFAAATVAARSAAGRSNVELRDAHVRVIYETGETHESGLSAVERTTVALAMAADQQLPTATIVETWNANKSAPGGIAVALVTKTRVSRLERLCSAPRAAEAFIVALDGQDRSSRTPTHPTTIDRALDIAERELSREAKQQFPGASSATGRRAGDDVTEAADTDRHMQQVIDRLRTEVERQQFEALRARTGAARLDQRNRNSVRPVVEKSPPVPRPARRVPDATWEDAEPLERALADLETATDRRRLGQRTRHAVTAIAEKIPPVAKPARLVPAATREDAVAAAPLIGRARLPEAQQRELRLGVDLAATELAGEFGDYQWWSHAGGELDELHLRDDRYLEFNDTGESPVVEIGMLRIVLEENVYQKAFRLVEHPAGEPNPPTNLVELVRAFIRRLQDAVDGLIDRVLARKPEPAEPAIAKVSATEDPARLTFGERYSQRWSEHAEDNHRLDFQELAAGASARNKLFERQELYSSKWTTVEPKELPISLAKPVPAWTDEAVRRVTWRATPGVGNPERTLQRQIVDAHLDDYESRLPEQYAHSAEWRAIRERAEEAVRKLLQDGWRYRRADRRGDDRKKRKLEADAINGACGRDARDLHREMMAARAAARPDWEVTLRIRVVQDAIRRDERIKQKQRPQERPVHRQPERGPTREKGQSRVR